LLHLGALALGLLVAVAGVGTASALLVWQEWALFRQSTGAASSAFVLWGAGTVLGVLLGWSRGNVRSLLLAPIVLGLGGALAGLLLGGLLGGMLEPVSRALMGR
jgi:hypothetical protein